MDNDFPTKNRKRAKRRFMKQKMKQKARKIAKYVFGWGTRYREWYDEQWIDKWSCQAADNLKACDCYSCSNPRKNKEKTIQEKKMDDSFREQLND
jgi:hypothetical protein